jgi:lysine biosynthesis protein LysW
MKDIKCPSCGEVMGVETEELDIAELIECEECGEEFEVVSFNGGKVQLRAMGEETEEEDVEEEEEF